MEDCKTENLLVGHCNSYWVAHHRSECVHVWWRVGVEGPTWSMLGVG